MVDIGILRINNSILFEILDGILHDSGIMQEDIQFDTKNNILNIPIRLYLPHTTTLEDNYLLFKVKKFPIIKAGIQIFNVNKYIFEHKNENSEYDILDVLYAETQKCIKFVSSFNIKFWVYVSCLDIKVVFNNEDIEYQKVFRLFSRECEVLLGQTCGVLYLK